MDSGFHQIDEDNKKKQNENARNKKHSDKDEECLQGAYQ